MFGSKRVLIGLLVFALIGGGLVLYDEYQRDQRRQTLQLERMQKEAEAARAEAAAARREAEAARRDADRRAKEAERRSRQKAARQAELDRNRAECAHLAVGRTFWMGFWKQNGRVVYVDRDGGRVGIKSNGGTEEFYCYQIKR
jgi:hypothetical protein